MRARYRGSGPGGVAGARAARGGPASGACPGGTARRCTGPGDGHGRPRARRAKVTADRPGPVAGARTARGGMASGVVCPPHSACREHQRRADRQERDRGHHERTPQASRRPHDAVRSARPGDTRAAGRRTRARDDPGDQRGGEPEGPGQGSDDDGAPHPGPQYPPSGTPQHPPRAPPRSGSPGTCRTRAAAAGSRPAAAGATKPATPPAPRDSRPPQRPYRAASSSVTNSTGTPRT
jgi:hypothetical protein